MNVFVFVKLVQSDDFKLVILCRWDEWVDESRVLKYNEANLEKYKQMAKSLKRQKPAIKRTINDLPEERSKKRKRELPPPPSKEKVCTFRIFKFVQKKSIFNNFFAYLRVGRNC